MGKDGDDLLKRKARGEATVDPIPREDPPDPKKPHVHAGRGKESNLKSKRDRELLDKMTEEDREKKEAMELLVTRVQDEDQGLALAALQQMRVELRTSTASMTSVPKALKFLRPHYGALAAHFGSLMRPQQQQQQQQAGANSEEKRRLLADVLSVLGMTMGDENQQQSLRFKLAGNMTDIGDWGHEYSRNLCGEIAQEYERWREHAKSEDDAAQPSDQQQQPEVAENPLDVARIAATAVSSAADAADAAKAAAQAHKAAKRAISTRALLGATASPAPAAMDTGSDAAKTSGVATDGVSASSATALAAAAARADKRAAELATVAEDAAKQRPLISKSVLTMLTDQLVTFLMAHNAEPEACDLLLEADRLADVVDRVDDDSFERVCTYLTSFANFIPEPTNSELLRVALSIFRQRKQPTAALRLAMKLDDVPLCRELFAESTQRSSRARAHWKQLKATGGGGGGDPAALKQAEQAAEDARLERRQMAYMLGRQHLFVEDEDDEEDGDENMTGNDDDDDDEELENENAAITGAINNAHLSESFLALADDLDVIEPVHPDDIYKTQLDDQRATYANVDSARANLASTFVSAFVNCGFGHDKLMTDEHEYQW